MSMHHALAESRPVVPATFVLLLFGAVTGLSVAFAVDLPLSHVLPGFQWEIIAIYIALDLFSDMVIQTGAIEAMGLRLARWTGGRAVAVLVAFNVAMFLLSGIVNNLAAILVLLPVIFVLLEAVGVERRYAGVFFGLLLAVTNLGGASTPIGDFPALLIMGSGLTSFDSYLLRAWPLFFFTTVILVGLHAVWWRRSRGPESAASEATRRLQVQLLATRHRYMKVDRVSLALLGSVLALMFCAWALVPADIVPPAATAVAGLALGAVAVGHRGIHPRVETFNLDAAIRISTFLFLAALASASGILDHAAAALTSVSTEPVIVITAMMALTALMSGAFSAGPAAAALLPVVATLVEPGSALAGFEDWVAVAFAGAICAGSSLFLWSATSGLLLSDKVSNAGLTSPDGEPVQWAVRHYLKLGIIHFVVQLAVAVLWVGTAVLMGG